MVGGRVSALPLLSDVNYYASRIISSLFTNVATILVFLAEQNAEM